MARRFGQTRSIYHIVKSRTRSLDINEIEFRQKVQDCLTNGRFALLIVGDKIFPAATQLADVIQSAPHLQFSMCFVELKCYKQDSGCPYCNPQTSYIELQLLSEMKYIFKDVKHRAICHGIECDIYFPSLKFAIEFDGSYWHKDKYGYDKEKTALLENRGISVLRIRGKGLKRITPDDIIHADENAADFDLIKRCLEVILRKKTIGEHLRNQIKKYLDKKTLQNVLELKKMLYMLPSPLSGCSLAENNVSLSKEWHPTKNGRLTPKDVTPNSSKKVWWKCKRGHEWRALVSNRNIGTRCPYCIGKLPSEVNSLQSLMPEIAQEWHPYKNGTLTPLDVTYRSHRKVWWLCKNGHEWETKIINRRQSSVCPYCLGIRKYSGKNYLK